MGDVRFLQLPPVRVGAPKKRSLAPPSLRSSGIGVGEPGFSPRQTHTKKALRPFLYGVADGIRTHDHLDHNQVR